MKSLPTRLSSRKAQSGFTLVEIAIVLVIIGLLLGGVLKGQELIENGRVKNAANDLNGISAAYTSYLDRYRRLPGDDGPNVGALQARGGPWATITQAGNNNGVLAINAGATFQGTAVEAQAFFQHLRAAGFINGNPADAGPNALPVNAWGGRLGVTANQAVQGRQAARPLTCMSGVPGKAAAALDVQLDDGVPSTGALRATVSAAGAITAPAVPAIAAGTPYSEAQFYTICRDLG
ncbi:MAG: prepilin-type N-terminal cleavage/methylation domain-containing protein [Aquabacterium sp.]|uniref:prepilin-type N-terminal cleavage/methylation domain-containing protein n=1 Tax=Aquabacterium sp. TaxID=1872578 RepID=UPI001B40B928|nr:prepilin-type N-terminal cleavage/methylation domain-containing protein [Aquabacterium sp.]MBP7132253.1 prepilin-type N-terminal cleavage/methylation domain-containing protein [Aquabacterium sp.]